MEKSKKHLCILANELPDEESVWMEACKKLSEKIEFNVINLTASDWLERLSASKYDLLLAKPPGLTAPFKQLYDERISIIDRVLNFPVYPTPEEIYIYENKRYFYSWLAANHLPCPKTWVFYSLEEARDFIKNYEFPLVAKVNIGASGSGVRILRTLSDAEEYLNQAFTSRAPVRWGPNFSKGGWLKRGFHYIKHPSDIKKKAKSYNAVWNDKQKGFILLQEYIPHDFEWRIVVIGDSYFAHKKMKIKDKASGSLLKAYDNAPLELFDFAKAIMQRFSFVSQAIDVFESPQGDLVINEMQCIFGQSDPYQMLVDGKPGRYRFLGGKWIFEPGDFNSNMSYDLRLAHALKILNDENPVRKKQQ